MQKTSKVKKIVGVNTRTHPDTLKTIYFHKMDMENGETISLGKQQDNSFKEGQEIVYTEEERNGKTIYKEYRPPFKQGGGGGMSDKQCAVICAAEMFNGKGFAETADKVLSRLTK